MPERVEFKVFTKMSKDSIVDLKELIHYAKSIGFNKVAITDFNNVYNFPKIENYMKTNSITDFKILYGAVVKMLVFETIIPITILVRSQEGLKNLYKIITKIKTTNLDKYGKEVITKEELGLLSDGLFYGLDLSYMEDIYENLEDAQIKEDFIWWDFIEVHSTLDQNYLKRMLTIAKNVHKMVIASNNVCYLKKEEQEDYEMLFKDKKQASYLKTTKEMLNDFNFLDENLAYEIVITNPNKLASLIGDIKILDDKCSLPQMLDSKNEVLKIINKKLKELCGENIPSILINRIHEELYGKENANKDGIINRNTESIFLISKKLVEKSHHMGYPVFVRGGVASSFIAYLMGITDINPLPPHYYCKKCKNFYFDDTISYNYGIDMPDKNCPHCQNKLKKDGFNIPYENFLGIKVEKIPDIDINFADCIQKDLICYLVHFWGKEHTVRAGAIGVTKTINALEEIEQKNVNIGNQDRLRLAKKLEGKLKHTGQHPGGVFLIPKDKEVYDFTPCNYPHNNKNNKYLSTHFDYHYLNSNIIKFDLLGHRLPTIIKELEGLTNAKFTTIPLNEKDVFDLLNSGNTKDLFEFDDDYAESIIKIIKPKHFDDLVKVVGLLHSTDITNKIKYLVENKIAIQDLKIFREDSRNLENVGYVPLKAHIISYTLTAYKFAWYKAKFPTIFREVMKKY